MTASYDAARPLLLWTLLALLPGCGARTALDGVVIGGSDGGTDAGTDAGPPCTPGPEVCNGRDDDCDGAFDEDLGFGEVRHVVVRSTEGTTGPCSTCQWTAGPQLFVHSTGMLAVWRMGFDGSHPQPNAWARRLDRDASPLGEPFVLFDDVQVPNGLRLTPIDDGRAALAFCGRFGFEDLMASAFVGPDGAVLVPPAQRGPSDVGCGAMHPDVGWTGDVALFAWTNNRGTADFEGVHVERTDRDGRDRGPVSTETSGDLSAPPRFARGHGGLAMVTGFRPELRVTRLRFFRYDASGREIARADFDAPPDTRWGETDIAATPEGWLVVGTDRTSFDEPVGWPAIRLDPNGGVIEGPLLVEPGWEWSRVELEPRPGGGAVIGGLLRDPDGGEGVAVMRVDERGRRIDVWRPDPSTFFGLEGSDLVVDGGRVYFMHVGPAADSLANEVVLHVLGCVE